MAQKLFMPYSYGEVLAGYKVLPYVKEWGFRHFGVDLYSFDNPIISQRGRIFALGEGEVFACGADRVGNVVVIIYPQVELPTGEILDLVQRCYHLARIDVRVGGKVNKDTQIGIEGNTGTGGYHLHMELDRDTRFPCYSPQVKGGEVIKHGTDTTIDPLEVLYARRNQVIVPSRYGREWNNPSDCVIRYFNPQCGEI